MSSLLQAPPRRIPIGGGPDGGPGGPGGPGGLAAALAGGPPPGPGPGGPPGPGDDTGPGGDADQSQVVKLLRSALTNITAAAHLEADDVEAAQLSDIAARLHKVISMEQSTRDAAMGAGPAAKMVRKASNPPNRPGAGPGRY